MGQGASGPVGPLPDEGGEDSPVMKAFVMETPGDFSAIQTVSVYIPRPETGEIKVKVFAAGLNPVDAKRSQFEDADFPCILGSDVAGMVVEVGSGVTNFKVGDKVYYHGNVRKQYGAFAEYAVTTANTAVLIPEGLSFTQAAATPCSGWSAYIALYHKLKVRAGQSILIAGASGGVGSFAVQLAKLSGLTVFAVTKAHKKAYVQSLGADHVLVGADMGDMEILRQFLACNSGQLVDHALDTMGGPQVGKILKYLKLHGSMCSLSALVTEADLFVKGISLHYINIGGVHQSVSPEQKEMLVQVAHAMGELVASERVRVPIMEEIGWSQIPGALGELLNGRAMGKLVANIIPRDRHDIAYRQEYISLTAPPGFIAAEAQKHSIYEGTMPTSTPTAGLSPQQSFDSQPPEQPQNPPLQTSPPQYTEPPQAAPQVIPQLASQPVQQQQQPPQQQPLQHPHHHPQQPMFQAPPEFRQAPTPPSRSPATSIMNQQPPQQAQQPKQSSGWFF